MEEAAPCRYEITEEVPPAPELVACEATAEQEEEYVDVPVETETAPEPEEVPV